MTEIEYQQLVKQVDTEHRLNLEAIERVRKIQAAASANTNGKAPATIPAVKPIIPATVAEHSAPIPQTRRIGKGKVLAAVRFAIKRYQNDEDFTTEDLIKFLAKEGHPTLNKGSIKAVLQRLIAAGDIEVTTQGSGRRQSEYRRKK